MNAERLKNERRYEAAVATMNAAATVATFEAAVAEVERLRVRSIELRAKWPTAVELRIKSEKLARRSRGLDD